MQPLSRGAAIMSHIPEALTANDEMQKGTPPK